MRTTLLSLIILLAAFAASVAPCQAAPLVATSELSRFTDFLTYTAIEQPGLRRPQITLEEVSGGIAVDEMAGTVTFSDLAWSVPAHTFEFTAATISVAVTVEPLEVRLADDVFEPIVFNLGTTIRTLRTDGLQFVADDYRGTFEINGPLGQRETGTFSVPWNPPSLPDGFEREIQVGKRADNPVLGSIEAFSYSSTVAFEILPRPVTPLFDGVIDGIPFRLETPSASIGYTYRFIPEPHTGFMAGLATVIYGMGGGLGNRAAPA